MDRPDLLIEQWLPTKELGIESVRERAAASALPPIYFLHVWWARRPLVASAAAVLASLMPAWNPDLAERFVDHPEIATQKAYHTWFQRLVGILGDPVEGRRKIEWAKSQEVRLPGNPYGYKQAYKNSPTVPDLRLLHDVLRATWGRIPHVLDPTAGGGSIPFETVRYGLPSHANDLNSIAVSILRSSIEIPSANGMDLLPDLKHWGKELSRRIEARLAPSFRLDDHTNRVMAYIWVRTVACPRTGKPVPLAPNWWLSKEEGWCGCLSLHGTRRSASRRTRV